MKNFIMIHNSSRLVITKYELMSIFVPRNNDFSFVQHRILSIENSYLVGGIVQLPVLVFKTCQR
jgi:hypothetical protein